MSALRHPGLFSAVDPENIAKDFTRFVPDVLTRYGATPRGFVVRTTGLPFNYFSLLFDSKPRIFSAPSSQSFNNTQPKR